MNCVHVCVYECVCVCVCECVYVCVYVCDRDIGVMQYVWCFIFVCVNKTLD